MNKLAQINFGELRGIGPLGLENLSGSAAPGRFNLFISGAIGLMTAIAMIWFIFNFIIGAIGIISAGGDKGKVESARNKITTGLAGIVVVIASIFIIQAFGSLIGIGDIILNPTSIIDSLNPTGGSE
jgi:hypothetical protein